MDSQTNLVIRTFPMRRFHVHYECNRFGFKNTYIAIDAVSPQDATDYIKENGIGYSNGRVYADKITKVEEIK